MVYGRLDLVSVYIYYFFTMRMTVHLPEKKEGLKI